MKRLIFWLEISSFFVFSLRLVFLHMGRPFTRGRGLISWCFRAMDVMAEMGVKSSW